MKKTLLILLTQLSLTLGLSAQTQQELRDSVSMISKLIEEHPKAVNLYMRKAALYVELNQWEKARDEYSTVLEMMPSHLGALYYRGFVNQHLGRSSFARRDYETLLLLEPLHQNGMIGLIIVNLSEGKTTQAFDLANRLVEASPTVSAVYSTRADVELHAQQLSAAADDIERAIALEEPVAKGKYPLTEDDAMTNYQLAAANIYLKQEHWSQARRALDYLLAAGVSYTYLADYYTLLRNKK